MQWRKEAGKRDQARRRPACGAMTRFCRHVAIFRRLLSYLHKTLQSCNPVRACLRWVPLAISQSCMRAFVFRVWMIECSTHARAQRDWGMGDAARRLTWSGT
jgi:hypothetical protein